MFHSKMEDTRPVEWFDEFGEEDEEYELSQMEPENQIEYLLKKGDINDSTSK